jgi:hypothetical protein
MSKSSKITACFLLILASLVLSSQVNNPRLNASSVENVQVLEIAVRVVESYVPGCVNCPRTATRTPVFNNISDFESLAGAKKVVTHSAPLNVSSYSTSAGGCAISKNQSLLCWGANGAGQLGDGSNVGSSAPVAASGIGTVTDVGVSGATTCAISSGDLWCVGLGPWPDGSTTTSTWIKLNDKPVANVFMGTHIASSTRGPICVMTLASRFECLRTTQSGGSSPTFEWIDSLLPAVTGAATSQIYYPGQSNMCVLTARRIACGTVDNNATFNLQQRVTTETDVDRLYMFDYNYPAVCGWSNGMLSCGLFTYPPSSPYTAPSSLRVVGVVPEPLSLVYREVDTISRVYIIHPTGVLHISSEFLYSPTYAFGSAASIIAPVLGWKTSSAATSQALTSISGSTNSASLIPGNTRQIDRSLLGSRNITIKSNGQPLVGSLVTWTTTDDPSVLQSSSSTTNITDASGQIRFPQIASGSITFTISGGRIQNGAFLQTAVASVEVGSTSSIEVELPSAPSIVARKVAVQLQDGTPVPNAEIKLKNSFLTYGFTNAASSRAAWSAQQPDARGYLSTVACAFCMVNPPTYLTDSKGSTSIPTFGEAPRGAEFDATASYDDGVISQSSNVVTLNAQTTVTFQFMQSIRSTMPSNIDVKTTMATTISGNLVDDLGQPMAGVNLKVQPICDETAFGGLWSQGVMLTSVACTSGLSSKVTTSSVQSFGARCSTSAPTNKLGVVRIRVCARASTLVRLSAVGNLASRTVCLRVNKVPCQTKFEQVSAKDAASSISIPIRKRTAAKTLAIKAGLKVAKTALVTIKPVSVASGQCSYSNTTVSGLVSGFCRVQIIVKPLGKRSTTTSVVLRVT